jgi:DNA-binding response OmpR family regulator
MLLVVEDEALIRGWLKSELTNAGFEVTAVRDGDQAIAELTIAPGRFSTVITDIRHGPGPDGWEIGRRARELDPAIAVVYVTSDVSHAWLTQGVPGSLVVSKPYEIAQIVAAIATLSPEADTRQAIGSGDG